MRKTEELLTGLSSKMKASEVETELGLGQRSAAKKVRKNKNKVGIGESNNK